MPESLHPADDPNPASLPAAEAVLNADDRAVLDEAFATDPDPLNQRSEDERYRRLFSRIVMAAPEPIGVGPAIN